MIFEHFAMAWILDTFHHNFHINQQANRIYFRQRYFITKKQNQIKHFLSSNLAKLNDNIVVVIIWT